MSNSLGREPSYDSTDEAGQHVQVFSNVTEEDYSIFSSYLTQNGCTVSDYSYTNGIVSVVIKKDDVEFTFKYHVESQEAVLTYPKGTQDAKFDPYRVGASVFFGSYEQDNNTANGKEAIEWIVIHSDGDERVMISKYILETRAFHEHWSYQETPWGTTNRDPNHPITWSTCDLRKWLNNSFYNTAFNPEERSRIVFSKISNPKSPIDDANCGKDTEDNVYLLSVDEILLYEYFGIDNLEDIQARGNLSLAAWPTPYAKKGFTYDSARDTRDGAKFRAFDGAGEWWLRTMSRFGTPAGNYAIGIGTLGNVRDQGIVADEFGIRPVIRIRVSE